MTGTLSRDTGTTTQVDERLGAAARDFLGRPHRLFIDGQWVDAADGRTFGTIDPATGAEAEARVNHPVVVKPEPAEKSSEKLHHTPAATLKPVTCPRFASRNSGGWASG